MRLFELHPSGDLPGLTLHPRVTVIRGLKAGATAELKNVLRHLAGGQEPGWAGTADVHGVLIPLDGVSRLVGPSPGDAVIAGIEDVLPPVPRAEASLAAHQRATIGREAVEAAVTGLVDHLAELAAAQDELRHQLSGVRQRIDQSAGVALDRADAALRQAARERDVHPFATLTDPDARVAELETLVEECDRALTDLPEGDRAGLAAAIATLRWAISDEPTTAPEAAALAEVWQVLHRRLDGIESRMEMSGGATEEIAARLEAARARVEETQAATTPREVTADEAEELEAMHVRVVALEARATSGVRRGSARRQLEEVHAALSERLDALGYPTWMAYRMGNGLATVSDEDQARYDAACAELERAERAWADLMARIEADPELNDVLGAIERIGERAAELLGVDVEDIEGDDALCDRLARVTVDDTDLVVDIDDATEYLATALDTSGAHGHRDLTTPGALLALGEAWLEVLRAADDAAVRLLRDRERAGAELAAIAEVRPGPGTDLLAEARSRVESAEQQVAVLRETLTAYASCRRDAYRLAQAELAAAENHDAKVELLDAARELEQQAARRAGLADYTAPSAAGISALVPRGLGGPVPMIVELGDAEGGSLVQLTAVARDVQVIAIGGGEDVRAWVDEIGPDVASLVEVGAAV